MFVYRHFLEAVFNPYIIGLSILVIFTVGLHWFGNTRSVRIGITTGVGALILFSMGWLPMWLTRILENQYPVVKKPNPNVHWVVVLGGGQAQYVDGEAHNVLYTASIRRLLEGIRLYRLLPHAKLLLSGGEYGGEKKEAHRLAEIISWLAIPHEDIVIESNSSNTASQARELKKRLNQEPFYLVTSAIHLPRAMALCRKQGLKPIAAPTDFTYFWQDERWEKYYLPNPKNLVYLNIAWHEILGRAWARLQGQA
ncbi:YdcF family protein [Legionella londiniensis]|uniref:Membrane protein n=1 Tax=Legionella londiniensis TaxID=45068 RepID=A0A0W0VR42_9GAMM|nr:ElyC/SanA/YdcF family protein [Legionella londiniensis]KTD22592.1 membrane protein [Legionella londiniensis]STX92523.1 membrane protein [Legionella londiniensis]